MIGRERYLSQISAEIQATMAEPNGDESISVLLVLKSPNLANLSYSMVIPPFSFTVFG